MRPLLLELSPLLLVLLPVLDSELLELELFSLLFSWLELLVLDSELVEELLLLELVDFSASSCLAAWASFAAFSAATFSAAAFSLAAFSAARRAVSTSLL